MSKTVTKLGPRIVPVTFGDCAGWLHPAAGKRAVILCGALNHEILPLYQSWHVLAGMIAEAGLPVLRFDYHGTGDSLGDDRDPSRVEAWLNSIEAAARFMREEAGIETLDVVGIRLGATLAALSAKRLGAERLALIAPVLSGRTYLREAKVRSNMLAGMWRLGEADSAGGDLVSDGFVIRRETAADISRLALTSFDAAGLREALLMPERQDAGIGKLACNLEQAGCPVTQKIFGGYATAVDSATLAHVPLDDWREVVRFLAKDLPAERRSPALPKCAAPLSARAFREERVVFGSTDRLAGVLCRPTTGRSGATAIFVNTGGNPHLGWGRMSVAHARALAMRGVASLRMDIAGLGDATPLDRDPRAALYRKESIADLSEALDLLEARGLQNFVLVGHCSGAWLALQGALADERVSSLFAVNLPRFIWTGKENLEALMAQAYRATDSYLKEIGSGMVWRRMLKGDINWPRIPGIATSIVCRTATRIGNRVWPIAAGIVGIETESARVTKMLTRLAERGTRVRLVYSDADPGRDELARHFGPSGRRLQMPNVGVAVIGNADHDITSQAARAQYLELLLEHLGCAASARRVGASDARTAAVAEAA
ncbi:MAG: hypothetical protein QOJ04_873 [Caballeronia sp.]|nr:hypothetical protein [Caballeronia sp.]